MPNGVGILVAAVDVQGDRLEAVVKGYGTQEESWLIAFTQIQGDPARPQVWLELDKFLQQEFTHESGRKLRVTCTVVDSGGLHTEHVYLHARARHNRRVFPIKGGSLTGRPLVERPSSHNRYRVPLFVLCVDTGKDIVMSRLMISTPGPGFMHLPAWTDAEYIAQKFTSTGTYLTQWGSFGSGDGQFKQPWGVATDAASARERWLRPREIASGGDA